MVWLVWGCGGFLGCGLFWACWFGFRWWWFFLGGVFCLFGFLFLLGEVVVVLSELCVKREFVREILEVSQKTL